MSTAERHSLQHRRPLIRGVTYCIVFLAIVVASFAVPFTIGQDYVAIGEGPDEVAHLDHVFYRFRNPEATIYVGRGLVEPGLASLGQGHQPPFYYFLGTKILSFLLSPSDVAPFWDYQTNISYSSRGWLMGGGGNCSFREDHKPMTAKDRAVRQSMYTLRVWNSLLFAVSVALVFLAGRIAVPKRPAIALSMAAFHAAIPTALWRSSFVTNDNLVSTLGSIVFLIAVIHMTKRRDFPLLLAAGAIISALTFLTKYNGVVALGMLLAAIALKRGTPLRRRSGLMALSVLLFGAIVAPELWDNYRIDGEVFLTTAIAHEFPYLYKPSSFFHVLTDSEFLPTVISRVWLNFHNLGSLDPLFPLWKVYAWWCLLAVALAGTALLFIRQASVSSLDRRLLVYSAVSIAGALAVVVYLGVSFPLAGGRYVHMTLGAFALLIAASATALSDAVLRKRPLADAGVCIAFLGLCAFGMHTTLGYLKARYSSCAQMEMNDVQGGVGFGAGDLDGDGGDELLFHYRHPGRFFFAKYRKGRYVLEPKWTKAVGLQADHVLLTDITADKRDDLIMWRPGARTVSIVDAKSILAHDPTLSPFSDRAVRVSTFAVLSPQVDYPSIALAGNLDDTPGTDLVFYNPLNTHWVLYRSTGEANALAVNPAWLGTKFGGARKQAFLFPYGDTNLLGTHDRKNGRVHLGTFGDHTIRASLQVDIGTELLAADLDHDRLGDLVTWKRDAHCIKVRESDLENVSSSGDRAIHFSAPRTICLEANNATLALTSNMKVFAVTLKKGRPCSLAVADRRTGTVFIYGLPATAKSRDSSITARPQITFNPGFM